MYLKIYLDNIYIMSKPIGSGRKKRVRSDYELQLESMIRDKKKLDGTPYSEQSITTFLNGVMKLGQNFLGKAELMVNLNWLQEPNKIIIFINESKNSNGYHYSLSSKLAFYQAIIICLTASGMDDEVIMKPYWTERDNINIARSAHYEDKKSFDTSNGKNQVDVLNGIMPDDILKMIQNMNELSFNDKKEVINRKLLMIATIIRIHTEFPWRNDLADVKLVYSKTYQKKVKDGVDKEFNWLIFEPKQFTFIINRFKTAKKYNQIIAPVENPLVKEGLKNWVVHGMPEEVDDTHLFTWHDNQPITRNNISVLLSAETKKFLKKPISTTLLCKIFDETKVNIEDMTTGDFEKLKKQSYLRGHDPKTRITIYRNPNNK
tara:strand:- start:296 stop:1420 length:1125 start_codon:yes stop_codon:yes gene_type:complete